jgi:hypothetical protein
MGQLLQIWPMSTRPGSALIFQTWFADSWPQRRVGSREIRGEFSARQILQKAL